MGKPSEPVDREKLCPFLMRLLAKVDGHHREYEFPRDQEAHADELRIYTWRDATLGELADVLGGVFREARWAGTRMYFSFVFVGRDGRFTCKDVGTVVMGGSRPHKPSGADAKMTLEELGFVVGDYVDVAIHPPARSGKRGGGSGGGYGGGNNGGGRKGRGAPYGRGRGGGRRGDRGGRKRTREE